MSSGIIVFFIQNLWTDDSPKRNSIPCRGGRLSRYMSPCCCSSGVRASSTEYTDPDGITTLGPVAGVGVPEGWGVGPGAAPHAVAINTTEKNIVRARVTA